MEGMHVRMSPGRACREIKKRPVDDDRVMDPAALRHIHLVARKVTILGYVSTFLSTAVLFLLPPSSFYSI